MDQSRLKEYYGFLQGLQKVLLRNPFIVREQIQNYHKVLGSITKETDLDYALYSLDSSTFNYYQDHGMVPSALLAAKVEPLLGALELKYGLSDKVVQLGSIFQAIKDDELRNRCADILTAVSHFDRVINQATLVLEDRIRTKSGIAGEVGVTLVNKAISSDHTKTVLRMSVETTVHEGLSHVFRGVFLAYRNPTHHHVISDISREDALKICGFIDHLLDLVNNAQKAQPCDAC
jgi:uncharacterized protein (TIGR02391 family)